MRRQSVSTTARAVLVCAAFLTLMTGCSCTSDSRNAGRTSSTETRSPVSLQATPPWIRSVCGGFLELRRFCPAATPAGGNGVTLSMAVATPGYPLNLIQVESGGEYFGDERLNRPPRFVGWFLMSGRLGRVLPTIFPPRVGPGTPPKNGQADAPRRHALFLGRVRWGDISGQLLLAPSAGNAALVYFHYLVFHWREPGGEVAIGLHAWEPFRETVQTLHAMVDRLHTVPASPIAMPQAPHSHPVAMTSPPDWLIRACRSLRTRLICPTRIPVGPTNYVSVLFEPRWRSSHGRSDDLLSVEWGAPRPDPARNRPPAFAHLELSAGDLGLAGHVDAGPVAARDGMMAGREGEAAAPVVRLESANWRGHGGSLLLGDCFGNHLCYRWREGDAILQVDVHGWEPFTETVATLRQVVRSIR
jgi:hypothetical protein